MNLKKVRWFIGVALAALIVVPTPSVAVSVSVKKPALPNFAQTISYYPYGQYSSKSYREWEQALSPLNVYSSPAYVQYNVKFEPTYSLVHHAPVTRTVYRIQPTTTTVQLAEKLAKLFGLKQTISVSKPSHYGSVTATTGTLPKAIAPLFATQSSANHGLAVIGSAHGLRWVYGDGSAMAWRKCRPGDVTGKNASMISHSSGPGKRKVCTALPAGRGPTEAQAIQRSVEVFRALGFQSSLNAARVSDGGLLLRTQGFDETQDGRSTYYSATVYGFLKVGGQFTSLKQQVTFSSSSERIVTASGFAGIPVAVAKAKLRSPALAARQISVYDLELPNSAKRFDPANPIRWGPPPNLSTSITGPRTGMILGNQKQHNIPVSKFQLGLDVIQAYDGTDWLVPIYTFTDAGGYLGSVQGLPSANLKIITYPPFSEG